LRSSKTVGENKDIDSCVQTTKEIQISMRKRTAKSAKNHKMYIPDKPKRQLLNDTVVDNYANYCVGD